MKKLVFFITLMTTLSSAFAATLTCQVVQFNPKTDEIVEFEESTKIIPGKTTVLKLSKTVSGKKIVSTYDGSEEMSALYLEVIGKEDSISSSGEFDANIRISNKGVETFIECSNDQAE